MVPLDGGKSQRSRGGGGRAPRAQSMGGALGPAHALVLRVWGALGPPRPAKRRRPPRRNPTATCYPHASTLPSALQRWLGGAQEGPGVPTGGGGVWRQWGGPPGRPTAPNKRAGPGAKGPGPRSFRALRAPPPQFAKVVGRGRQGGFLQLPCSLGFRLAVFATGGARLPLPPGFPPTPKRPKETSPTNQARRSR